MKSVIVYNSRWATMGGGEKYLAMVASVLAGSGAFQVSLLADDASVRLSDLQSYFNLPLDGVSLRVCSPREVGHVLAQPDICVIQSNFRPHGRPARRTVYVLHVPYGRITPLTIAGRILRGEVKEGLKDLYRADLMRQARLADLTIVNSRFCQEAFRQHHGIRGEVLYASIDGFAPAAEKKPLLLSVGRFFRGLYNDKRYDVLIPAFRSLHDRLAPSAWEYHIAGSCPDDAPTRAYVEFLREEARGYPVHFHLNCPYGELRRLYAEASIFWHAAGYGVDEWAHPERTEHFGMSTVEAMTAGCLPVVINKGGQKEIVSHGESGYLWNTPGELVAYSQKLLTTPVLAAHVREEALRRSRAFDREHFARQCLSLFQRII